MDGRRVSRVTGLAVSVVSALALSGAQMADQNWRGGGADGGSISAGRDDSAGPYGPAGSILSDPAPYPDTVQCDWPRQPLPDDEIEIPNPDDYLIPDGDGAYLLPYVMVDVNGYELPLAELEDLKWIAESRGISVEEAIFRFGWQERFAQIADELQSAYPDELAGMAIVNDGCGARIGFKRAVPQLAVELSRSLPVPVELVGNRGYSEAELVEALHVAYTPLSRHPEVASASGGPDSMTGVITIEVQPRGDTTPADRDALCAALQPPPSSNPAIEIRLILVEDFSLPHSRIHLC